MKKYDEAMLVRAVERYKQEAKYAKHDRMQQNQINFDTYHMKQDYSHKRQGQSQEFLPKQSMAVEQATSFLQQGLADLGEWWKCEQQPGLPKNMMKVKPSEIYQITNAHLLHNDFMTSVGDMLKLGFLGSLIVVKVHGHYCYRPKFVTKLTSKDGSYTKKLVKQEDKVFRLKLELVRQEDYYPDPTGGNLYEMQEAYSDYFEIKRLSEGPDAIYDKEAVERLRKALTTESAEDTHKKSRETGQNTTNHGFRRRIKLTEVWGNIIDDEGELLYENVVTVIADDRHVIRKPTPNPFWHGKRPFIAVPLIRVPHSVWHKALMDAPTYLNRAINEFFNLTLDGGLMAVHGIKQIREDWLEDPQQVEEGISAGDTLRASASCPPGAKVLETVTTSSVPQDGLAVLNLANQEFNSSALTNDLRMNVTPFRAQKATEVVESSQTITGMFAGIAKTVEEKLIEKILYLSWATIAQHYDELDQDEVAALLGDERQMILEQMGPEEMFSSTVQGMKFKVFGISQNLSKQKDFTKLTAFLQTLGASPTFQEEFVKKYDFGKLLEEIARSLDIDTEKLKPDMAEMGGPEAALAALQQGAPSDQQSQISQAGAAGNQGDLTAEGQLRGNTEAIQGTNFPASRATGG